LTANAVPQPNPLWITFIARKPICAFASKLIESTCGIYPKIRWIGMDFGGHSPMPD